MLKLLFSLTWLIISSFLALLYQNKQTLSIDSDCSLKISGRKLKAPELLQKNSWMPTGWKCFLGTKKEIKKWLYHSKGHALLPQTGRKCEV